MKKQLHHHGFVLSISKINEEKRITYRLAYSGIHSDKYTSVRRDDFDVDRHLLLKGQ